MKILLLLSLFFAAANSSATAQTASFDTARFTFTATYILPRTAPSRLLSGGTYDLRITRDSLSCFLPYQGRVYVAPIHPDSAGIWFSSTRFSKETVRRKKGWRITLQPRDQRELYRLVLEVASNGSASLQVYSNRRDMVGFDGRVE